MKKKKTEKRFSWLDWLVLLAFLIGLVLFLYPTVSNMWNVWRSEKLSYEYEGKIAQTREEDFAPLFEEAEAYNAAHQHLALDAPFQEEDQETYRHFLNPDDSDVMGVLEIPRIGQRLMIYYGTSDEVLSKGVGHMEGSSLPVGGESTHAVLAGHRGLPSARIFTDLDQLEEGDLFKITILDRPLAYRIDKIQVIGPDDIEEIDVVPGKDYVTLLTCTPYGVNTQRLLVRGERTELTEETEEELEEQEVSPVSPQAVAMIGGAALAAVLVVWGLFQSGRKRKKPSEDGSDHGKEAL